MNKKLTQLALALALGASSFGAASVAQAAAPMVKTQAPGYHRVMLGDFEITALSDGTVKLPMNKLLSGKPEKNSELLKRAFLDDNTDTSVNSYLINTGDKLILVDTGAANLFGPTLGDTLNNLKAAGYKPEQVDHVLITHIHPDHVGGLMNGNQMAFPNATVHIEQRDIDFWLSQAQMDKAPEEAKGFFKGAMASVNPYVAAGKVKAFSGDAQLLPGIKARPSYGHTPGHAIFEVESKGQKLVIWGDLIHVGAVQFDNPTVTFGYDSDPKAARKAREKAFAEAAQSGALLAATHIAFPGMGHLVKNKGGKGYTWLPLNYQSLK